MRSGSSQRLLSRMKARPASAIGTPTAAMLNMPRPTPRSISRPLTTRFVLVPISVQTPPRMAAKLSGIISLETDSRYFFAQSATAGTSMLTTGVLFSTALSASTGAIRRHCAWGSERGRPSTTCTIQWMPPVSRRPATTPYSTATVIMPSLEKPLSAAGGSSTPVSSRTASAATNTASAARLVSTSRAMIAATTASVNHAAKDMGLPYAMTEW